MLVRIHLTQFRFNTSNFGISTFIVMHLLRHTVHSPIPDTPWLTAALMKLRFQKTMGTFGMFFLHDLDTNLWYITGIEVGNPEPCQKYFKKKTKELTKFETKAPEPPNTEATPEYPCGETPNYST